jgi:hypothetical protein
MRARTTIVGWVGALALAGCGGSTGEITGTIGADTAFDKIVTVYNGGPNIIMFDRKIDCLDLFWVDDSYTGASAPYLDSRGQGELTFVGLQFSFVSDSLTQTGTFSVAGESVVAAWGLVAEGPTWVPDRGRDGTLTVTDVDPDDAWVEGTFDVQFTSGQVSGEFRSEYCRNIDP